MTNFFTKNGVHLIAVLVAAVLSLGYYFPLLQGKKIKQSDVVQYDAMARQLKEYRVETGQEIYWIDNAFGGMPTFQLGARYAYDILEGLHRITRVIPRPAHILFLYLIGAYFLGIILGLSWRVSALLGIAYGFSTYLLIILQVGHNTKALALAYMPFVFAGWVLLQNRKWVWGFVLSTLALGMNIKANHYQMTYYMLLLLGIVLAYFIVSRLWTKEPFKNIFSPVFLWISALVLALGFNAPPLLATAEYAQFSTRGASELTQNLDGSPKEKSSGLDYDYITQYSYGIFESLNLISPQIQGGGSTESLPMDSALGKALISAQVPRSQARAFLNDAPTYWGNQPILEAPAYIGAAIFFLFVLGCWTYKGFYKIPLLIGLGFSLALSWGKNFPLLTQFFIEYFPLYNKFRAVSSIQVLLEFGLPLLAALGLQAYFKASSSAKIMALRNTSILLFGGLLLIWVSKGMLSFSGASDGYYRQVLGDSLMAALMKSRQELFLSSLGRTALYFVLTALLLLWIALKPKQQVKGVFLLIALVFFDLFGVIQRYTREDLFVSPRQLTQNFQATTADRQILADTTRFRVYEPRLGLSHARTANFHSAIGGYHGAKPRRFEELIEQMQSQQIPEVLNFLNVKYILQENEQRLQAISNPSALGNAWAVDVLHQVPNADACLKAMKSFNPQVTAIGLDTEIPKDLAFSPADNNTQIRLKNAQPNRLEYYYESDQSQLIVFSEMYYAPGWKASIDGGEAVHFCVNYVLRAMVVPAGTHEIIFTFDPPVVRFGEGVRLASWGLWVLGLLGLSRFQHKLEA